MVQKGETISFLFQHKSPHDGNSLQGKCLWKNLRAICYNNPVPQTFLTGRDILRPEGD